LWDVDCECLSEQARPEEEEMCGLKMIDKMKEGSHRGGYKIIANGKASVW
jgi:hypothetical protein